MRKEVVIALLCTFLLLSLSGCAGSRTTTKEKQTTESQLREAMVENKKAKKRKATTAESNTEKSEKRNIVIEFTKVEYYPEEERPNRFTAQFQKADSTFNEEVRKALEETNEEAARNNTGKAKGSLKKTQRLKDKSKPPNVKSETTGRIIINGDTQETTETMATTDKDETTTEATITTTEEDIKATTQSQEKKRPKVSPILWVLIGCGLVAVIFGGFYIRSHFLRSSGK